MSDFTKSEKIFDDGYVEKLRLLTCSEKGLNWEQKRDVNIIYSMSTNYSFAVNNTSPLSRIRFANGDPRALEDMAAYFLNLEKDDCYVAIVFKGYAVLVVSGCFLEKKKDFYVQTEIDHAFCLPNDDVMMNKYRNYCEFIRFIKENYIDKSSESLNALKEFLEKRG